MIEIDISKLDELISLYENYIKQMDKNNLDLITEFNAIRKYWHDQKCINMYNSFELEQKRILKNADNIKSQKKIYEYIRQQYSNLGDKVRVSLDRRDVVIDKINNVINILNEMVNGYDNLGDISFYPAAYVIRNQKKVLLQMVNTFTEIKERLNTTYNKINQVENSIYEMTNNVKVECFSLNKYENEV